MTAIAFSAPSTLAPAAPRPALAFTVPGDPVAELSPNLRLHHLERARRVKEWRTRTWLCWAAAGRVSFAGRVRITFALRRGRAVDPDNAAGSLKALLDGLCHDPRRPDRETCLRGDGVRYVELAPVVQETGASFGRQAEVLIRVEEVGWLDRAS